MSNELRRLAVLMGSHQRLGKDSLLSSLDLSVLGTIAEMSLGPQNIWTRVLYPAKDGTGENDQVAPDGPKISTSRALKSLFSFRTSGSFADSAFHSLAPYCHDIQSSRER